MKICLCVELDGHDFHERTKEQAKRDKSRDRELQASGWVVLRFTGSEVFNDPYECASETMSTLQNLLMPSIRERLAARRLGNEQAVNDADV